MTFPLYIINLSYLLESIAGYEEISVFNYLQLILSVLNFCVNPIKFVQKATLHDNKDFGIVEWLSTSLCFMPLVLIEIIHFFPFLVSIIVLIALIVVIPATLPCSVAWMKNTN